MSCLKFYGIFLFLCFGMGAMMLNAGNPVKKEVLCTHEVVRDENGKILSWYNPGTAGAGYHHAIQLASGFIKNGVPKDSATGMELYYLYCEFAGPGANNDFYRGVTGRKDLPHNPACVFAGFTESLAVKYRIYSGDDSYLTLVRNCLDHMLEYGTTPTSWQWANCPYASSEPGNPEYFGTDKWEQNRGDGLHVIEPDKVGEMGVAYLQFFEITEEQRYLQAAVQCAAALAENMVKGDYENSPWPNRVHAETGKVIEKYGSNVLSAIKLFDELNKIREQAKIEEHMIEKFIEARKIAWDWLFSVNGPMKTYVWKGYFEDTPADSTNANRVQITPLEVARYLIQHPEYDMWYRQNVPALINWCKAVFGTDGSRGYNAQCEQLICYRPMGSHSARYASVCAMWYRQTSEKWFRDEAFENFNWATYCTSNEGIVSVGTGWSGAWFSDGYGDYIKHFMDGIAAVPAWAPKGEEHLLGSTSVVQKIHYGEHEISYKTYFPVSTETITLLTEPQKVFVDGAVLSKSDKPGSDNWYWEDLDDGGVLYVAHSNGREVTIIK